MSEQGEPEAKSSQPVGCYAFVLLGVGLLVWGVVSAFDSDETAPDPVTEIIDACRGAVTSQLRAPSTADFPGDEEFVKNEAKYTMRGSVDAENGFGAQIRTEWVCDTTWTGSSARSVTVTLLQ